MRISDWCSDVCSSDLLPGGGHYSVALEEQRLEPDGRWTVVGRVQTRLGAQAMVLTFGPDAVFGVLPQPDGSLLHITTSHGRSEEHTSELQSLMRISYAVFCLKKKKATNNSVNQCRH